MLVCPRPKVPRDLASFPGAGSRWRDTGLLFSPDRDKRTKSGSRFCPWYQLSLLYPRDVGTESTPDPEAITTARFLLLLFGRIAIAFLSLSLSLSLCNKNELRQQNHKSVHFDSFFRCVLLSLPQKAALADWKKVIKFEWWWLLPVWCGQEQLKSLSSPKWYSKIIRMIQNNSLSSQTKFNQNQIKNAEVKKIRY